MVSSFPSYLHLNRLIRHVLHSQLKILRISRFSCLYYYNQQINHDKRHQLIMGIKTDITLYTEGTPNGLKASIVLEELGLEYKV